MFKFAKVLFEVFPEFGVNSNLSDFLKVVHYNVDSCACTT